MEQIKIDNFAKSHAGITFPLYKTLASDECAALHATVARRIGISSDVDGLRLLKHLYGAAESTDLGEVPDAGDFNVRKLLADSGLECADSLYVNWYRLDDVDLMDVDDLSRWFDDIWYPGSDDIEIFDSSLDWVISVRHDASVVLLRLPPEKM